MVPQRQSTSSPDDQGTETVDPRNTVAAVFVSLPAGHVVASRYEIVALLGRGGSSAVYRARDRELHRDIALKVLRPERVSPSSEVRLRREVNIARAAQSRHLVRIFDLGSDEGMLFLTMELVEGESLRQRLARTGAPGLEASVRIALQMLEGLSALHGLKTIHRDVKPENILIATDGTVKLTDFGLARGLDDDQSRATMAGSIVGTADYLSPEQALGQPLDERTDLYSAGIVLYEMLTGRLPFVRESSLGSMIARIGKPARAIRSVNPEVPLWLGTIVSRLLDPIPTRRYRTASEAADALRRQRFDVRSWAPRGRTWLALLALVLGASAIVFLGVHRPPRRFLRLAPNGEQGIVAIGKSGETLWRRDGLDPAIADRYALVRLRPDEPPVLATVLLTASDVALPKVLILSFLDPENGAIVRQVRLPDGSPAFAHDARRYRPYSIAGMDADGDGIDEVFVCYIQMPEAPSFTIMYEPRTNRSRILLRAVGHHVFAGLHDVDGDGRKDALFIGINNAFDWINTMAAVRIVPWLGDVAPDAVATSAPDMADRPEDEANILWYTLLPRVTSPARPTESLTFDDAHRTIAMETPGRRVAVTMNGFLASEPSPMAAPERNAHRRLAYASYREGKRLFAVGAVDEALAEMTKAIAESRSANEAILVEVMQRADAALLIRGGHLSEGERLFLDLWQRSENASEVAYDAGVACYLHGDLELALSWYERGMGRGARLSAGKSKHEFAQGILFVLSETGRWNDARAAIDRYRIAYPESENDARIYDEYVRWRNGETPRIDELEVGAGSTDLNRYWLLEFRLARGDGPATLLPMVEGEVNVGSQPQCIWRALHAELLWRLGRRSEAASEVSRANGALQVERLSSIIARAHSGLVQSRFLRMTGGKS